MRLWPRSLVGRNALLLVGLIVLAELASLLLVRQLIVVPRIERLASNVAATLSAVRAGLAALPREQRPAFVAALVQQQAAARVATGRSDAADEDIAAGNARALSRLERRFVGSVSARMAQQGTPILWRRGAGRGLEVRLSIDGDGHWIGLPDLRPAREFSGAWLAATAATALIALLGAIAIQRRIGRPLRALVAAAAALSHGVRPEPLDESGPEEIATVARSFNQLVASLDATDSERSLLLAGVSHDLRTPLTKLRLGVEILSASAGPELAASLARSIDEMDRMVGQFVDHARAGDAEPLVTEPAAVDDIARGVVAAMADHGVPLATVLDGGPPLPLSPALLRRAVMNLVENAQRHGAPPVSIETGHDAARVWLDVVDRGPGIDAEAAAAMRRPFRRAGTSGAGSGGTGLGLSIVERVAARHGGRLELAPASSAAPRGLRARIVLPRRG